jgi:hypothetical protein
MTRFIKNSKRNPLERSSSQGLVLVCPQCDGKLDLCTLRDGDQAYWCHPCERGWRIGNLPDAAHRHKDAAPVKLEESATPVLRVSEPQSARANTKKTPTPQNQVSAKTAGQKTIAPLELPKRAHKPESEAIATRKARGKKNVVVEATVTKPSRRSKVEVAESINAKPKREIASTPQLTRGKKASVQAAPIKPTRETVSPKRSTKAVPLEVIAPKKPRAKRVEVVEVAAPTRKPRAIKAEPVAPKTRGKLVQPKLERAKPIKRQAQVEEKGKKSRATKIEVAPTRGRSSRQTIVNDMKSKNAVSSKTAPKKAAAKVAPAKIRSAKRPKTAPIEAKKTRGPKTPAAPQRIAPSRERRLSRVEAKPVKRGSSSVAVSKKSVPTRAGRKPKVAQVEARGSRTRGRQAVAPTPSKKPTATRGATPKAAQSVRTRGTRKPEALRAQPKKTAPARGSKNQPVTPQRAPKAARAPTPKPSRAVRVEAPKRSKTTTSSKAAKPIKQKRLEPASGRAKPSVKAPQRKPSRAKPEVTARGRRGVVPPEPASRKPRAAAPKASPRTAAIQQPVGRSSKTVPTKSSPPRVTPQFAPQPKPVPYQLGLFDALPPKKSGSARGNLTHSPAKK